MILVVAFCSKDADLQRRNLEWMLELDSGCGREGVLAYDTATPVFYVEQIEALAQRYFTKVHHCRYQEPPVKGWPAACNWAWQSTARWMFEFGPKQPWLWLEADATPLKSGWLLTLEKAHQEGGKAFGGHVVKDMGHMNGVGIYPWDVMRRNEMAMLARAAAWDVVLKPSTQSDCVSLNHLIQHAWNVHPLDRAMIWNGEGAPLSFKSQEDVALWMDFNAVLIHRVKDGSLIPLLREKHRAEQDKQRLIMSTEYNVPQHTKQDEETKTATHEATEKQSDKKALGDVHHIQSRNISKAAKVHILIVTYQKDAPWLKYCLALCKKYLTGFSGITVAYPASDKAVLSEMISGSIAHGWTYAETPGKGMVQHMAIMALADGIVPHGTQFVMHLDADCMYHTPATPADYFTDGKPDYLVRPWESLKDGNGVVSDCAQWLTPTEKQLGFRPKIYCMCRHPTIFPVSFYKPYREWIEAEHKKPFMEYMTSGRNTFPQDRMDWTAMGAFAYEFMRDEFNWIDVGAPNAVVPKDRQKTFWSHAGVKPDTKAEMEGWLK